MPSSGRSASAGSGAYKVRAYRPNEQYALDANEGWYKGAPKSKRIIVRHVAEPASQRLLLEKGDIDIDRNLCTDQLAAVKSNANVEITQGDKGALLFDGNNYISIAAHTVNAVDTNGAGDMFAGAFLYGITSGKDFATAGRLASLGSATVVSKFGPRLDAALHQKIADVILL